MKEKKRRKEIKRGYCLFRVIDLRSRETQRSIDDQKHRETISERQILRKHVTLSQRYKTKRKKTKTILV